MSEPYVEVPVSLPTREQINSAVGEALFNASNYPRAAMPHILGHDIGPLRNKVTEAVMAALSQPNPTAEPVQHPCERDGHDDYCGACAMCGRAAPPSIADMAPGTTFTGEAGIGWLPSEWTVGERHDGTKYVTRTSDGWVLEPRDIVPSTIRDVQIPEDAS